MLWGGYKLILKCTIFCALLLSFLLLSTTFISCAGGAGSPKGSEAEETALAIKLPDTSKALYDKEAIVSFTVTVSSGSFNSTKSANRGETMLFSNLPVGNYSVKAYGKTSTGAVAAKCETSVTIVAGETTTTTLHLARLEHWTVTFMNADGSELSTQDISDGYKATKPANPAPVSGKSFSGWTTDAEPSDTSPLFDFNTAISGDNITLRPVFGVITYTVKYVSPVGSFTDASFTAATASSYSLPPTSGVTGVTFDNWYSDSAFSSSVDVASVRDITTFTKKDDLHYEKTIYAKWTVRVQFKREDVTTHTMENVCYVDVAYGESCGNPDDNLTPPAGATFGGWYNGTYNESTGKVTFGSEYDFSSTVTENKVIYAKWNFVTHNVTYVSVPVEVPSGVETEFREIEGIPTSELPSMAPPTGSNFTFLGWTDVENFTETTTPITSVPANTTTDVTLYAMWSVQVSFDVAGSVAQNVLYGKGVTKPADPTNGTCEFIAWYKGTVDGEGNVTLDDEAYDFDDADVNKVTTSFTLYPKWRYTDFTGTAAEFLAAEFVSGNTAATKYNVTITSATASEIPNIGKAIGKSTDPNYKGVYINLDLSGCGATSLGEGAFCATDYRAGTGINQYLVGITLPSTLTAISSASLGSITWLTSITIPDSVTSIGSYAFSNCSNLTSITLPANLTSIGDRAFSNCSNLTSITLPSNLTSIGEWAFTNSGITGIRIPGGVTTISREAFENCTSLTTVIIENGVETIGYQAFKGCSGITSVSLPNSLTQISTYAFEGCTSLTSITIPASVTEIMGSFRGCTNLSSVSVLGNDVWDGFATTTSSGIAYGENDIPLTADKLKSGLVYRRQ